MSAVKKTEYKIADLKLVPANKPDATCFACSGLGYYQSKSSGELVLCECVSDLCNTCGSKEFDKKLRRIYNEEKNQSIDCKCMPYSLKFNQIKKLYDKSNIPARYKNASLEKMNWEYDKKNPILAYVMEVQDFLNSSNISNTGFYLSGGTGCGKTHIACSILNELILGRNVEARYAKVSRDFIDAIKESWTKKNQWGDQDKKATARIENELANVPVLVLDDFGITKDNEWAYEKFYTLLDTRCENERLTIITSNKPMAFWKNVFENRIYSRLCGMVRELQFKNKDYREYLGGAA